MSIVPFQTTNTSKKTAIDALTLAFENKELRILPDETLVNELMAYEQQRTPSGLITYNALGRHAR